MDTFPSTIYTGTNPEYLDHFLKDLGHTTANNPDLFLQNQTVTYSLEHIKSLSNFFMTKPLAHTTKVAVISNAHLLTTTCQNALLKTLEEPGQNNYILLITNRPQGLLATIRSRCHLVDDQPQITKTAKDIKITPSPKDIKDCLLFSEEHGKDKESAITFLEEQLQANQKILIETPNLALALYIKKVLKSIDMIKHNVDPKSSLDWLLLT